MEHVIKDIKWKGYYRLHVDLQLSDFQESMHLASKLGGCDCSLPVGVLT